MKIKLLASSVLLAGTLMASGTASAALEYLWQGTLTDWYNSSDNGLHSVVDDGKVTGYPHPLYGSATLSGDGDTTFTYISSTFLDPNNGNAIGDVTNVTLKEEEFNNGAIDLYNVGFGWGASQSVGEIRYSISTTDSSGFNLVGLDTVVGNTTGNVTKYLYSDLGMTQLILSLNSLNGAHNPLAGLSSFSGLQTIYVKDVINSGIINDIHNEFSSVPEPLTMTLMAMGLAALTVRRRLV